MTSNPATFGLPAGSTATRDHSGETSWRDWTRYLVPVGRALFVAIFLATPASHFSAQAIGYAAQQGVPLAGLVVPASAVIAVLGGLSILLGYRARIGAWLLVLFLVPVTLSMHRFWVEQDPMMAQMQMAMFMKNVALLGGALLVAYWGAGPISLDARRDRRQVA
ncbi:MAG: DoxX family protein [Gemmatimonadetes bacterium]|nr:DoxX family protein [Gemmatimonadota bacterium]